MNHTLLLLLFTACSSPPSSDVVVEPTTETSQAAQTPGLPSSESVPYAVAGLANGAYAPEVALDDKRTDTPFSLSSHLGPSRTLPTRAAIVSFSASWCGPCKASLPQLAELKREHGDDLLVLIVSIDGSEAGLRSELRAVEEAGLDAPVVHAPEAVQRAWLGDTRNIPHIFLLNQIGEVMVQDRGYGDNVRGVLPRQLRYAMEHPDYVDRN